MIDNRLEYQRMYEVERKLWWYSVLHNKILAQIKKHYKSMNPDIRILDAACGTGGLLSFLNEKGYTNSQGFDYSKHAIEFSIERGLDVGFGDLKDVDAFKSGETFDVICCCDALYFLTDSEIVRALQSFKKKLNKNGVILINIHAFEAFSGTHDLAVGSARRFTFRDFKKYATEAGLHVAYKTYWPFALSLPIWLVRTWQKFQIRNGRIDTSHLDSDVSYPGNFINSILKGTMSVEQRLLHSAPFGSSLFIVMN